jgi:hypothetical protein
MIGAVASCTPRLIAAARPRVWCWTTGSPKRRGLSISPAGVRCVWQRHDLTSMKHRLKALEAKVAQDGVLYARLVSSWIATIGRHPAVERPCPGARRRSQSAPLPSRELRQATEKGVKIRT